MSTSEIDHGAPAWSEHPYEVDVTMLRVGRAVVSFKPLCVLSDAVLVLHSGRIAWIGPASARPGVVENNNMAVEPIDLPSATVLPGLMDAHVHLMLDAGPDPIANALSQTQDELQQLILDNCRRFLAVGVTTVRDLGSAPGSVLTARESVRGGEAVGPTIVAADQPLTSPAGHLSSFAIEVSSDREVGQAVGDLAARGADVCKVVVTGGRMTPGTDPNSVELPADLLSAATRFAHAEGMSVAAHCLSTQGIVEATAAGVDTIEHGTFIDDGDVPHDERSVIEIAKRIAGAGVSVSPTLNARSAGGHPMGIAPRVRWVQLLHDNGVNLALGNDTGIPNLPPELYLGALEAFTQAGLSTVDVLHAATAGTASAMGIETTVGTLTPGKRADLIAVADNPIEDLAHLAEPILVIAAGRVAH